MRSGIRMCLSCAAAVLCLLCPSCSDDGKTFSKAGMSITLTDDFIENDYYNLTAHYEMEEEDVTVSAAKEEFSAIKEAGDDISSKEEYASVIMKDNDIDTGLLESEDGLTYFVFRKTPYDTEYVYYAFVFETEDAFWLFQFGCESESEDDYRDSFMKWAGSIRFD